MPTRIALELDRLRANLASLERLERSLIRATGRLEGEPGEAAIRVGIGRLASAKTALDQAEAELEIEDGLLVE